MSHSTIDRALLKRRVESLLASLDQIATPMLLQALDVGPQFRPLLRALPPLSLSKNSSAITKALDELEEEELWVLLHRLRSELAVAMENALVAPTEPLDQIEKRAVAHLRRLLLGEG